MTISRPWKRTGQIGWCLIALLLVLTVGTTAVHAVRPGEVSWTAEGVTALRMIGALAPDEKIRNPDYLAVKFISPAMWHYSVYNKSSYETNMKVIRAYRVDTYFLVNARTNKIDQTLHEMAADGLQQVVVLGAGFDSRAYRFGKDLPGVRFFELDHPPTSLRKQALVKEIFGKLPTNVTFIPIEFNTWNVEDAMVKAGYDSKKSTCFIWEGVSMYLTAEAVDRTLRFIATRSALGSTVIVDYIPESAIKGDSKQYPGVRRIAFRMALAGEPILSGLPEGVDAIEAYMNGRGLEVLSVVGHEELTRMYLVGSDGKPSPYFRIAHARVPVP